MSIQDQPEQNRRQRHELHNASVDESAAAAGACAQVHLPTGRICVRGHGHDGSCDFTSPGEASTAHSQN